MFNFGSAAGVLCLFGHLVRYLYFRITRSRENRFRRFFLLDPVGAKLCFDICLVSVRLAVFEKLARTGAPFLTR